MKNKNDCQRFKRQLHELTETFLEGSFDFSKDNEERSVLHIILSDSIQAINFVTLIEDEFEIEFDDEEIDIDFFLSFSNIASLIRCHKNKKGPYLVQDKLYKKNI